MKIWSKHSFSNWLFALAILSILALFVLNFAIIRTNQNLIGICNDQQKIIEQYEKMMPEVPGKSVTW